MLVVALLLLPIASAGSASGSFLAAGHTRLPPGAQMRVEPLALLGDDASGLDELVVSAPRLRVHLFEVRYAVARTPLQSVGVYTSNTSETYALQSAALHLSAPASEGFVAAYARPGARATLVGASASDVAARAHGELSTATGQPPVSPDPFASREHSRQVVDVPHAVATVPGALAYEGPLLLKVKGLRLAGSSSEGALVLDTRPEGDPDVAGERTTRWAILEADDARVEARSRTPWQMAWSEADASWQGMMTFSPLAGELRTDGAAYPASATIATLDGRFTGFLSAAQGDGGTPLTRLTLEGDVSRTTLSARSDGSILPAPRALPGVLLAGILVVAGAAGLGFGTGALYGRRKRPSAPAASVPIPVPAQVALPFSAEDCCDAGAKAASEEDWAAAAKWFARARSLAPTSARICADLAFSLSQIGDVDEALRHYAEASRLSTDGEADFNAALAALHGARPLDEVEHWLERALARTPGLVAPLEADDDFKVLHGRARYEDAVARAWARMAGRSGRADAS